MTARGTVIRLAPLAPPILAHSLLFRLAERRERKREDDRANSFQQVGGGVPGHRPGLPGRIRGGSEPERIPRPCAQYICKSWPVARQAAGAEARQSILRRRRAARQPRAG